LDGISLGAGLMVGTKLAVGIDDCDGAIDIVGEPDGSSVGEIDGLVDGKVESVGIGDIDGVVDGYAEEEGEKLG
jgi:hypothetical protein